MKFLLMKNYIYIKNLLIIYLNETIHRQIRSTIRQIQIKKIS